MENGDPSYPWLFVVGFGACDAAGRAQLDGIGEVMGQAAITRDIEAGCLSGEALAGFLRRMDAMASKAGVGMLLHNRLLPGSDGEPNDLGYICGIRGSLSGPVVAAKDLDTFDRAPARPGGEGA